jgi:GntR family transcriptional regulator / MocR family aminotransferase
MPASPVHSALLSILLDPRSKQPLYKQLYTALRQAILNGQLAADTKLPSTRTLAHNLGISRSTVVVAFEQLLYEGYIRGSVGSGSYVESVLPDQLLHVPLPHQEQTHHLSTVAERSSSLLSRRGKAIATTAIAPVYNDAPTFRYRAFQHGIPALDEFPFKLWSTLATKRWRQVNSALFGYGDPLGYPPLRREIAAYVNAARGVRCSEEQVIITAGSQQAIHLTAHLLLDESDPVWIEDPCYLGARGALISSGAQLIPVPIDQEGLSVSAGIEHCPTARMVYVTPSHQFPLGTTMSLTRRLSLLQWASQTHAWIFEDDYDSEYRYAGRPLASLQGLDTADTVIYCGTFSKVLFPALRLGYLVVPQQLVEPFRAARAATDRHSSIFDQLVLTDFMTGDHFARHIRRMRNLYAERQAILIESIQRELVGLLEIVPNQAGMHIVARLPQTVSDTSVQRLAQSHSVALTALSHYYQTDQAQQGLIIGYSAFNQQQIQQGIQRLASMFNDKSLRSNRSSRS